PVLLISIGPIADSFLPFFSEDELVEHYHLIKYYQRGQDGGTRTCLPVSFAEHAADAAALLDYLGVRRAHVAGHSTGALIALQLAADKPDVVQTLALLEPPLAAVPSASAFFDKAAPALAAYGSGDREEAMARFMSVAFSLDWETCRMLIEEHVPGGVAQAMKATGTFFDSYLPALNAWRFGHEQAAAVSQPVLSVLGTETDPWFIDGNQLLHAWFPQIEDCRIEGVTHLLHMQRPAPVARGVAAFFARHPMTDN
ncbi:MAG TPA: alpha/beta hydrolase, partial [Thermomicrobiales bacterium]|nr:alpha/beta hydrolase [Thermomicrobiales bacterium]